MATASFLFVVLTDILGVDINSQTYWSIVGLATAYILGEAAVDFRNKK